MRGLNHASSARKAFAALIALGSMAVVVPASAQDDFSRAKTVTHDLGAGVYVLETTGGSRTVGNMTFAVGDEAIILVDAGFLAIHDQLYDAIRAVSDKPVRYLISTHHHPDHANGNPAFEDKGVIIIGHDNMRKAMLALSGGSGVPADGRAPPGVPAITYTNRMTVWIGEQSAQIHYPGFAHSGGDSIIFFPSANVLTTGDIFATGRYPRIDTGSGGGIDDMIRTVTSFIDFSDDTTTIVPGHGRFAKKADVVTYRDMLIGVRDLVGRLKAAGLSVEQIRSQNALADFDRAWSPSQEVADQFLAAVYQTVN